MLDVAVHLCYFNAVIFIADKINVLSTNIQQFNHQQYNIEMTIII